MMMARLLLTSGPQGWSFLRVCLWLAVVAVLNWPVLVSAHGGGVPQLTNVTVGPYWIFAWSSPESIRVGDLHISMVLLDTPSAQGTLDKPVLDADVKVTISPLDRPGEQFTKIAVNQETLLGYYYESDFKVPAPGRWQVSTSVTGKAGMGSTSFELEVLPAQRVNWRWVLGGLIAVLVVCGLYGQRANLANRKRPEPSRNV